MSIEKAKKLKALADRGYMKEKDVAKNILSAYCKKHNINIEELDDIETKQFRATYSTGTRQLLVQIISMVCSSSPIWGVMGRKQELIFEGSESDCLQIKAMYDHYQRLYLQELEIFKKAFVHRNNLYNSEKLISPDDITVEQYNEIKRMQEMSETIQKKDFRNQIESPF